MKGVIVLVKGMKEKMDKLIIRKKQVWEEKREDDRENKGTNRVIQVFL